MAETPQSYVETPKTVDNKPTHNKQDITIESVLQEKFPDSPEKQQLFQDIFLQPDFVSLPTTTTDDSLSQDDILTYLQNGNLIGDARKLSKGIDIHEKTEIMFRNMNLYFKTAIGKEKNVKTYEENIVTINQNDQGINQTDQEINQTDQKINQTDQEINQTDQKINQTDQEINQTDQEINQTDQETNQTDQEINQTDQETNQVERLSAEAERLNAEYTQFLKTKKSFAKLPADKQIQVTKDNKKNIPDNVITNAEKRIQAIKKTNPEADISINEYLSFYLTAQQEDLQGTEFQKDFEELNIMRGTTITLEEAAKPRNAYLIAKHNESCSAYLEESEELNDLTDPRLPETKDFEEEFTTYVKFIPDQKIREEIESRKEELMEYDKQMAGEDPDSAIRMHEGETEKFFEIYEEQIRSVKKQLPGQAKDISKKSILGSCITGIAKYFDSSTEITNKKGFEKALNLHTQESISIDTGKESENEKGDQILSIQQEIDGKSVEYYYNLNKGTENLKSKDAIGKRGDGSFTLSEGGEKKNLNIDLPTIAFLTSQTQQSIDNYFAQALKDGDNIEEFEIKLNEIINEELSKQYSREGMVESIIEKDIEKNITAQSLQDEFLPDAVLTELNKEGKSINNTNDKKARKILEIWDKSTETMSFSDLGKLKTVMEDLDPLIAKEEHPSLKNNMRRLLKNVQEDRDAESYTQDWGKGMLKFFRLFSKDGVINITDLEKFKDILQKEDPVTERLSEFSPDFQTQYEEDFAPEILQLENDDLWNNTPTA